MTETDDVWGRAVGAAADALGELWDAHNNGSADFPGDEDEARRVLAAALPVLLADLADRIETMAGALLHIEGYWCGHIDGLRSSADVVRSFASEVSRG